MLHPFEMFGGTYILTEWRAFGSAFLFCEFTPLYGLNPCFFKKREKHVPWPLEKLQPKQYQGRVLAKNRKNTSLGPNIHTISCRPKGRSAPLACCLPCATGRRCCHGALPHRVWRPGAPLTALKNCGTQARSKAEGVNTHRSLPGRSDGRLRGRMLPRKLRLCVWIKG